MISVFHMKCCILDETLSSCQFAVITSPSIEGAGAPLHQSHEDEDIFKKFFQ